MTDNNTETPVIQYIDPNYVIAQQKARIETLEAALKSLMFAAEKTATRFECYDELYEEVSSARRALEQKP